MRALITGSTGFIGSRLIKKLELLGYDLRVIARKPVPGIETITLDLEHSKIPSEALDGVDTIFHLAGYAHDLREKSKFEKLYYLINVDSTVSLAKLAVKNKVKKFIFVSTVKAGPLPNNGQCISEDDKGDPVGIYGKTKRDAEINLLNIARHHMHVSIIRSSLVYGPNLKGNLQLMFSGIRSGWFPPLPEIGNRRSMIHVDDLVRAIVFVANKNETNGQIYIATDGTPYSSREVYDAMRFLMGKTSITWHVPRFLFKLASLTSKSMKYKVNKLLGDECYSSKKLHSIGFRPMKTIKDMNETSY